ncbi:MAG: ROK family protein [bacterium]
MRKAIGIDIGGTNTRVAAVDEKGNVLQRTEFKTPRCRNPKDTVIEIFARVYGNNLLKKIKIVGCGVPAVIHPGTGFVDFAPNLGWKNFQIKKAVQGKFGIRKIVFENDACCAAWGVYKLLKKKVHSLCVITLGTGIGGGFITGCRLYSGIDVSAFEIGHTVVDPNGRRCGCGSRGCLETFCGARHINKWASKYWQKTKFAGRNLTPLEIAVEAGRGARWAKKIWEKYGEYLGISVASMINILAVDRIVFTGGIASAFPFFKNGLMRIVRERTFPSYGERVKMTSVECNRYIGSIGAALLALQKNGAGSGFICVDHC